MALQINLGTHIGCRDMLHLRVYFTSSDFEGLFG